MFPNLQQILAYAIYRHTHTYMCVLLNVSMRVCYWMLVGVCVIECLYACVLLNVCMRVCYWMLVGVCVIEC